MVIRRPYSIISCASQSDPKPPLGLDRRQALASVAATLAVSTFPSGNANAIQGLTAGRIPGVTGPDKDGYYTYTRPEGKSGKFFKISNSHTPKTKFRLLIQVHIDLIAGGHGVGWSEIPRYSFKIPEGWDETPVSIADLGGTEIDLRYGKEDCGSLFIVVAPVLRFLDVGYNADVRIGELGPPDKIISGFAPELFGSPIVDGDVLATETATKDGLDYYYWEVKPHHLIAATAVGNRLFILSTTSNSLQWRRAATNLRIIQKSFTVPKA